MLDYEVVVVDDATCAGTEAEHEAALFNIRNYFGSFLDTASVVSAWTPMQNWAGSRSQFCRERR
jgi:nicotinamidase-related amidase